MFLVVLLYIKAVSPLLIAGAIYAGSTILGGLLNKSSQSSANSANRSIANRTNQMNYQIAKEQNEFNERMQRETMDYLSPLEQRRMYEEAGYSPYAYLSGGTGSPGMAQSSGLPNMSVPTMIPETGLGESVIGASQNFGNTMSALADADLKSAQSVGQQLENSVFSERTRLTFESMGLSNAYQRLTNKYAGMEKEASIDLLHSQKELTDRQLDQVNLSNQIQAFYRDKIQPQELQELNKRINLLVEQGKSQISLREYYSALGHSAMIQAKAQESMAAINQFLSKYQAKLMSMQALDTQEHARLNKAIADGQIEQNVLTRCWGTELTLAQIDMLNSSKGVNEALIEKVYWESEQLQKNLSWTEFNNIVGALVPMGIVGKIFGIGTKAVTISGFGK